MVFSCFPHSWDKIGKVWSYVHSVPRVQPIDEQWIIGNRQPWTTVWVRTNGGRCWEGLWLLRPERWALRGVVGHFRPVWRKLHRGGGQCQTEVGRQPSEIIDIIEWEQGLLMFQTSFFALNSRVVLNCGSVEREPPFRQMSSWCHELKRDKGVGHKQFLLIFWQCSAFLFVRPLVCQDTPIATVLCWTSCFCRQFKSDVAAAVLHQATRKDLHSPEIDKTKPFHEVSLQISLFLCIPGSRRPV